MKKPVYHMTRRRIHHLRTMVARPVLMAVLRPSAADLGTYPLEQLHPSVFRAPQSTPMTKVLVRICSRMTRMLRMAAQNVNKKAREMTVDEALAGARL